MTLVPGSAEHSTGITPAPGLLPTFHPIDSYVGKPRNLSTYNVCDAFYLITQCIVFQQQTWVPSSFIWPTCILVWNVLVRVCRFVCRRNSTMVDRATRHFASTKRIPRSVQLISMLGLKIFPCVLYNVYN